VNDEYKVQVCCLFDRVICWMSSVLSCCLKLPSDEFVQISSLLRSTMCSEFHSLQVGLVVMNEVNGRDNVFVRCVSVYVCARSGPVNQTSLKWLKLWTSNLTCTFPGTIQTWPLKHFSKRGVARVTWPPKFLGVKC